MRRGRTNSPQQTLSGDGFTLSLDPPGQLKRIELLVQDAQLNLAFFGGLRRFYYARVGSDCWPIDPSQPVGPGQTGGAGQGGAVWVAGSLNAVGCRFLTNV